MKKIIALFIAFASFSCTQAQKSAFSSVALNEKLLAANDSQVAFKDVLKKHKGKTVVIEVWASWCGDCVKAMPKLKELQANHPKVDYVFISMDKTADKWKAGIEKHEIKGDHYMANDQMKGVFGKPSTSIGFHVTSLSIKKGKSCVTELLKPILLPLMKL